MTDKQISNERRQYEYKSVYPEKSIVIDGVDVSRCEFCDYKSSNIPQCRIRLASFESICEGHNCYYKQLKRSEAQCEGMFVSHTDLEKKYKAKEQECEELKTENKKLKEELLDLQLQFEEEQLMYEI